MNLQHLSDSALLKKSSDGDEQAFGEIFDRHFGSLFRFALQTVREEEDAKELVMDVMLRLWQRRETVNAEDGLRPYLFKSVKNALYNHFRKQALQIVPIEDHHESEITATQHAVDEAYFGKELNTFYKEKLRQLPPQCQLVFRMSREDEMSHAEIANHLNISVNTVKNHIKAALSFFRKNMKSLSEFHLFILFLFEILKK